MNALPFLETFLIILAAGVAVGLASKSVRLPSVVGFLLTGIAIGPTALRLVPDRSIIEVFAEFGVVMLLYFIGLEFSLAHLRRIRRFFMLGGSLQVGVTTVAIALLLAITGGFSTNQQLFLGFVTVLSSTAIVLKMLADRSELDAPHGRLAIAISLFQDMALIPVIVLTSLAGTDSAVSLGETLARLALNAGIAVIVMVLARRFIPALLKHVAAARIREVFLLTSLLICLALAELTHALGFSYALGAFLAGLMISETEYHHEVIAEIIPFRDLFTSMFFVSAGMLLDLSFVWKNGGIILGLGIGVMFIKMVIVYATGRSLRLAHRSSLLAAAYLGQVGEFSFVLFGIGQAANIIDASVAQYFLSASVLTMVVSPLLIKAAPSLIDRFSGLASRQAALDEHESRQRRSGHVVIVGYGVNGQNVGRVLVETGIPFVVVEADGTVVRHARQGGPIVLFGDATRKDILMRADVGTARMLVIAISDPIATRSVVALARTLNTALYIIVRTRSVQDIEELTRLGANEVIPEEFETSIEIFTRVLDRFHIPRNIINAQIKVIRDENYAMLRGLPQTAQGLERMTQILSAGTSDTFLITDGTIAAGSNVAELALTEKTGVLLIAVVRGDTPQLTPGPSFVLEPADSLVLVGTHAAMDAAFDYLSARRRPPAVVQSEQ